MPALDFADPAGRTLGRVLRRQADRVGDRPFVVTDAGTLTYGQVDELADRCADGFHRLGVGRGDTVAILAESSAELLPITFGINRLGAVWIPTNTDYTGDWLLDTLRDSRAEVLVIDADLLGRLEPWDRSLPFTHLVVLGDRADLPLHSSDGRGPRVSSFEELTAPGPPAPRPEVSYGDTAAVLWTSGTTGRAKGVMQSHNAWIRASLTGAASSRTADDDVLYCCLPLYNSAGWIGVVYRALVCGVPFALDRRFSVSDFWDRTRHFGATQAFTLGTMHLFLWQAPPGPDDADNPVRSFGAIPMPDPLLQPFKERFGIEIIQQGYGQSEIMGLVSRVDDGTTRWNPGAAGKPLPGIEVRLLDDDDLEVPTGEPGELCVRPTEPFVLFNGYFHDPESTVAAWRNLWYHTGDLGKVDADGQFHFVDRKADYIRFKGRNVSSAEVEGVVRQHPGVEAVAAFGVPSPGLETEAEIMVAVVAVAGSSLDPESLARHVNECAPYFLVPRFIEVVEALPLTPTGKVRKHLLRERGVTAATWDREAAGFEVRRPAGAATRAT